MNGFAHVLQFAADGLGALTGPTGHGIGVFCLAIVFAWSGMAKLRRPELAALAIVDFGLTRHAKPILGYTLGTAEAALAVLLVVGTSMPPILLATAALLWLFAALIARSLLAGERFACFCFGDGEATLSGATLARTLALAALATALALAPVPTPLDDLPAGRLAQVVAAGALVGTAVLAGHIRRLLEWNQDPLGLGDVLQNERGE
jgi:hypothetical protein